MLLASSNVGQHMTKFCFVNNIQSLSSNLNKIMTVGFAECSFAIHFWHNCPTEGAVPLCYKLHAPPSRPDETIVLTRAGQSMTDQYWSMKRSGRI